MEFLLMSFAGLILLALASLLVVEAGFLIARIYSRLSFWFRYHYLSWSSLRQVNALKRRYGRRDRLRPSLGRLRFTRTRAEQFGDGPPEAREE